MKDQTKPQTSKTRKPRANKILFHSLGIIAKRDKDIELTRTGNPRWFCDIITLKHANTKEEIREFFSGINPREIRMFVTTFYSGGKVIVREYIPGKAQS